MFVCSCGVTNRRGDMHPVGSVDFEGERLELARCPVCGSTLSVARHVRTADGWQVTKLRVVAERVDGGHDGVEKGGGVMRPSEIREDLLAQHGELRQLLAAARFAAERWTLGEAERIVLRDALAALLDALRSHNAHEESALREVLRGADSWGPVREQIMDDAHVDEHGEVFALLARLGETEDPVATRGALDAFAARLLDHMAREEAVCLDPSVLRDDDVAIDSQGG